MNITDSKPLFTLTTKEFQDLLLETISKQNIKTNSNSEEIDIDTVAEIIGCKRGAIYAKTYQNAKEPIPHFKSGKNLIFNRADILQWNQNRKKKISSDTLESLDKAFLEKHRK